MKSTITYHCPNCGGGLQFDPEKQKFTCEYCLSDFSESQLEQMEPAGEPEQEACLYTCPSCGAQIVTDATTAASWCYYCHNPVILSGRLSGEYHPDYVIPFAIDREKALGIFHQWIRKKQYLPKAFYSEDQIQKLSGVYFPYLMYSCQVDGRLDATADRLRVWVSGNYQYTETQTYQVRREGTMEVSHVPRNALKKADRRLAEGVFPFDLTKLQQFSMGYLSGFLAEKRDMDKGEIEPEVQKEVEEFSRSSLLSSVPTYDRIHVADNSARLYDGRWEYALLPVWTLTYHDPSKDKLYYFTINGQTGKVCGVLPVDLGRLAVLFASVFLPVCLILLLMGYLI